MLEILAAGGFESGLDHTGATDTDIDHALRFAWAGESASHERVVLRGIGKDDELGTAESILGCCFFRQILDDRAHQAHGVHIDPGA